ncbi:transcriptional regulator [Bacteriovorax sp. BAL6_X]|uniref:RrF2 family transcriptional regulator n=1 Tax=Bacteriovorax sp. BAL6_X TaxID=1201290 RepID=UPI00038634C2|nr:Rrf2 family transcriptional regulator [Bacteriovorax sp. BAL6_X]EPZ52210.1 transcriptional regulator [Bacteriovorax sp. BAL6_X]
MRLRTKTDYCLRVLIYLQLNEGKVRIQDIADSYNISKNHLSVAVNKLSELGYVISTLGPKGGIEFNKEFEDKSIGELVSQVEDFDIVECFNSEKNTCTLSPKCKLKNMLNKATNAFLSELKNHKIKDLV